MPNPFQKVYDAVFELLFSGENNPLAALIKPSNQISFDLNLRNPVKTNVTDTDAPEILLVDEGGTLNIHANSSANSYIQNLSIYCQSGDYRYSIVSSINWAIMCNMQQWQSVLSSVTWNGETIVKKIEIVPISIGESSPERPRFIKGWNLIWRLQITLYISNVNLTYTES